MEKRLYGNTDMQVSILGFGGGEIGGLGGPDIHAKPVTREQVDKLLGSALDAGLMTSINLADQEAIELTIPEAVKRGMGITVKRPIANAVWKFAERPSNTYLHAYWERMQQLMYDFLQDEQQTTIGSALRFTLYVPGVHTAIVGTVIPQRWLENAKLLEAGDIRLMKLAHCNVMAVGIFSWASLEPEEEVFQFKWLDHVLDTFAENGIYAWLATPSGARPAWMSAKYPEVLRTRANRQQNLFGQRHNHCFTSPVYREKVRIMNSKLAERYTHHPALIGWHISNEYGGECHCSNCQSAFRQWVQRKYSSLAALNSAWWTTFWSHTYTNWSQIESPAPHGESAVHGINLDWKRFVTDQTINFYMHEIAPLKSANSELPCTTNMMDLFYDLDYRKLAEVVDVVAWDAYPTWHEADSEGNVATWFAFNHDLFRSLKKKPFMLMESTPSLTNWQPVRKLKRPGMHRLSSLQAVAHGSDTVQYFLWRKSRGSSEKFHGAVIDHVRHEHTRVFKDVSALGQTLAGLSEIIGTPVPAETAILFDWDNRWAVNDAQGPRNKGIHYEQTVI